MGIESKRANADPQHGALEKYWHFNTLLQVAVFSISFES
jgi:hypothetical protein